MGKQGVQQIIDSVREAVECECWIPALTTALIIPDIMGRIEFPDLVFKNGKRRVGDQYKAWFKEHVEHRYADQSGFDKKWKAINPYFSSDMCWQLRCAVLHQGTDDIDYEYHFEIEEDAAYSYAFELRSNACDSYGVTWQTPQSGEKLHKVIQVCVDVKTLCDALCDEAQKHLDSALEDAFRESGINIVDVGRLVRLRRS